jgi:hypothetical protein
LQFEMRDQCRSYDTDAPQLMQSVGMYRAEKFKNEIKSATHP